MDHQPQPSGSDDTVFFGQWLRQRRRSHDLTQDALAQCVGCVVDTVRKLEAGLRRPSSAMAERLAQCLSIPLEHHAAFLTAARAGNAPRDLSASRSLPPPSTIVISAAPASVSIALRKGYLPAPITSFIGREWEVATVATRLRAPEVRLVTLTGAGGIGKTRLAIQIAGALHDAFPQGIWFVNLAPINDPDLVIPTIAQAFGVRAQHGPPTVDTLRAALREQQLLLVLDNFEQVVASAPAVAALLVNVPGLKALVTSREALRLSGEHVVIVAPLAVPEPVGLPVATQLMQYAAVRLFVERAQAVAEHFCLTDANASAVTRICARLDGLPLAIELAAARVSFFPPASLLARLDQRLPLLTRGPRDLPARQQTLHNTIDWSYQLLSAGEQAVFRRLAVFVGGCTIAAAEAVCGGKENDVRDVLEVIASLVDKSLLRQTEQESGEPRLVMLETIREYALTQLDAAGEMARLQARHAAFCLELAEIAAPQLRGKAQPVWLARLVAERGNLRQALSWTLGGGDVTTGVRLMMASADFWLLQGQLRDGLTWLELALGAASETIPSTRARLLQQSVDFVFYTGDYTRASALEEEALALYRALDDRAGVAQSLKGLAELAWLLGDLARSATLAVESLALFRALGDDAHIAQLLHRLGDVMREQGEYARAHELFTESLALFRELGDQNEFASALNGQGDTLFDQGDLVAAKQAHQEVIELTRATGWGTITAFALSNLGSIVYMQGDTARGRALLEESMAWFRDEGVNFGFAPRLQRLAAIVHAQGDTPAAKAILREALQWQWQLGNPRWIAESFEIWAHIVGPDEDAALAARLFGAAAALRITAGMPLPPVFRTDYDHLMAMVRTQLGAAAFAAAWAEGNTLSRAAMEPLARDL